MVFNVVPNFDNQQENKFCNFRGFFPATLLADASRDRSE